MMFKKLAFVVAGLVTFFIGSVVAAQEGAQPQQLPHLLTRSACDIAPNMLTLIKERYGEDLLFMGEGMTFEARSGQAMNGGMMFFVNQETGTWSVLQLFGDGVACMLMNGRNFMPYGG
jgi:hypothetical protein